MSKNESIDLTIDAEDVCISSRIPNVELANVTNPEDYNVDEVLKQDSRLQSLSEKAKAARRTVQHRTIALNDAKGELRLLEKAISDRTRELVDASESRIDWVGRTFPWDTDVHAALTTIFGISSFRPLQREAINASLSGRDVLSVMPTGSGKSLVFQLVAVVERGITVVVTPLIALMQDQTEALRVLGIDAFMLDASTSKEEADNIFSDLLSTDNNFATAQSTTKVRKPGKDSARSRSGNTTCPRICDWRPRNRKASLLYVTPERVSKSKKLLSRLQFAYDNDRLARFCFDEVHCISQWGHDFRNDYLQLGILRQRFRTVPLIALTATATDKVIDDVCTSLSMRPVVLKGNVDRPNLRYEVRRKSSNSASVIQDIGTAIKTEFESQAGIVYVLSRKDAEEIADVLYHDCGVRAGCYHGDMTADMRQRTYSAWCKGSLQVVVATVAFGLGINKADVRFVIHHCVASSLEGYYQESGRAGRDGKPSKCILYWRPADMLRVGSFVADKGDQRLQMLYNSCRYASGLSSASSRLIDPDDVLCCTAKRDRESTELGRRKRQRDDVSQPFSCRRAIIAHSFGEQTPVRIRDATVAEHDRIKLRGKGYELASDCCDLCRGVIDDNAIVRLNVSAEARNALRIVQSFAQRFPTEKVTLNALASDWGNTGTKGKRIRGDVPALSRLFDKETRLEILVNMVLLGVLSEYYVYGAYSMQAYVDVGDLAPALEESLLEVCINIPSTSSLLDLDSRRFP